MSDDSGAAPKETITAEEIADLLHMQPATFLRRRHKLTAAGMPRPVPGVKLLWSRALIRAWINTDPASGRAGAERAGRNAGASEREDLSLDESPHEEAEDGQASYLGNVRRALEARAGVGQ